MITEELKRLGLNEKQITVYLAVMEQGKTTYTAIARMTKINRTTVYSVAKELTEKGLITEDLGGTNAYLVALPPQNIFAIVEKAEKELFEKKKAAEAVNFELNRLVKLTKYSAPKITFIDEKNLEKYFYKQTPIWNRSLMPYDRTWWGFQDKTFVKHYEAWIDWYWEKSVEGEIYVKLLSNESAEAIKRKKFKNRIIKFWKKSNDFTATTWVTGDYVIMVVTSTRPHYLVEINDKVLAHNMRELFKGMWEEMTEIEKTTKI